MSENSERIFQKEAFEKLCKGHSVLIVAPTGLGKTRAALVPSIENFGKGLLGTRLIYTLPLRALAQGVVNELRELNTSVKPVVHHGDEPESEFFSESIVITTIDQYLTAFVGAPLSWASHLSHAAAGATLTSYSVFDEIHLLSPGKGLQLLFALLHLRKRWGLLSCVMTATLPPSVVNFLKEFCGLEVIEASEDDIQDRDAWRKVYLQLVGQKKNIGKFDWDEKSPDEVVDLLKDSWDNWRELDLSRPKKVIVFANTVDRAIQIYRGAREAKLCPNTLLAHSRFTKEDRNSLQENLQKYFGRNSSSDEAILITTQVAEAGLNISAPLVITDLCPVDSLIQRAGRCQRFRDLHQGNQVGLVLVIKPKVQNNKSKWYKPYIEKVGVKKEKGKVKNIPIAELSLWVLEKEFLNINKDKIILNWEVEKRLIREALDDPYCAFLEGFRVIDYEDVKSKPLGYLNLARRGTEDSNSED